MTISVITENTTVQNATPDNQYTGVLDTRLAEGNPTTNYSTEDSSFVRTASNSHFPILQIDLSSIGSGDTITSATLYISSDSSISGTTISVHEVLQTGLAIAEATWNTYSTGNNWGSAGAESDSVDYEAAAEDSVVVSIATNQYFALDVTSLVNTHKGGTLRLKIKSDALESLSTSEHTDGERPELVINHIAASGGMRNPLAGPARLRSPIN